MSVLRTKGRLSVCITFSAQLFQIVFCLFVSVQFTFGLDASVFHVDFSYLHAHVHFCVGFSLVFPLKYILQSPDRSCEPVVKFLGVGGGSWKCELRFCGWKQGAFRPLCVFSCVCGGWGVWASLYDRFLFILQLNVGVKKGGRWKTVLLVDSELLT